MSAGVKWILDQMPVSSSSPDARRHTAGTARPWRNAIVRYGEESPEQLLAHPANAKLHPQTQQRALDAAITELGWLAPVIVSETSGHVIDGHARISLALSRGEPTVPVAYVDLPPEQEPLALALATDSSGPAVYAIRNGVNGKVYVGSALAPAQRWRTHRKLLRSGRHPNRHLQGAWDAFGEAAFRFQVLEVVPSAGLLVVIEQRWMDLLHATDPERGYNLRKQAASNLGFRFGPEVRAKLSAMRKGNTNALGNRPSPETIEKRRRAVLGRKWAVGERRSSWTPERRVVARQRMLNNQHGRGVVRSEDFRAKVRAALLGRCCSEETRIKLRAAQNARWEGHMPAPPRARLLKGRYRKVYDGFVGPDGIAAGLIANLVAFSREHKLNVQCMYQVASGRARQHKGWTFVG